MNPDEVLIGKTSEGKTVVSESARKHEPKFPVFVYSGAVDTVPGCSARASAIVEPKSQLTDFREFIDWFTVFFHMTCTSLACLIYTARLLPHIQLCVGAFSWDEMLCQ